MPQKKVRVRALLDDLGQIDFEVDGLKAKHSRIKLEKDSGPHELEFVLQDHTGRRLQFDQRDPIWVDEDCPCPPRPGLNSDQLTIVGCDRDKLSTTDRNSGRPRDLRYQLNFISDDGASSVCDPVVQNGGGGGSD